jgi:hypothetical protein
MQSVFTATKDLDLLVGGDAENVRRACEALDAFGVTSAIVEAFRAAAEDEVVWFGVPPARVDLLKSAGGVDFDAAYERRAQMVSSGIEVPVVAIRRKAASKHQMTKGPHRAFRAVARGGERGRKPEAWGASSRNVRARRARQS